ncbi:hypothetical protein DFS33DRAFT_1378194 [Desarmillaria ectypa]|nr:hypothetical protein DFS33DRAFT_1378194 [Desarmillaria ectypa]
MSNLQGDGSSNPSAVERGENAPAAERSGEHKLDRTEDGQEIEIEEGGGEQGQDEIPATAMKNFTNAASAKKIFGTMRRPNPSAKKGNDPYNYEEKYPEDATY